MKGIGREKGRLYLLLPKGSKDKADEIRISTHFVEKLADVKVCHKRLGHVPLSVLKKLDFLQGKVLDCTLKLNYMSISQANKKSFSS